MRFPHYPIPIMGFLAFVILPVVALVYSNVPRERPSQLCAENWKVSYRLPSDVEGGLWSADINSVQRASDLFSWQEFIAINWPAMALTPGEPDTDKAIDGAGPRVWEAWKESHVALLPNNVEPSEWGASAGVVHNLSAARQAVQADGTLPPTLTDQHGNLVRYEVRMNRLMFDSIRSQRLYDPRQQAARDAISFPAGSMLIKVAWREVEPSEESRFLTIDAWIYDLKGDLPTHRRRRRMGLVGLHIMHKTPSAPQWIWSTFEHIDNVSGEHASFHNHAKSDVNANAQTKLRSPNQVTRVLPISSGFPNNEHSGDAIGNVRALNQEMQQALRREKSVLQYYELVGTQWPVPAHGTASPDTVIEVHPTYLANTTMETFTQETSSCTGCHAMARTNRADSFVSANFTFTLNNATSKPTPDSSILAPPTRPVTTWDRRNWRSILLGLDLTEHTYERLPNFAKAKLHCATCHQDAGRNPNSSWWVGMIAKYKYPATNLMYARINQCMQRSMNGNPLPVDPDGAKPANEGPEVRAYIAYMQWLDEQYQARTSVPPIMGMLPIAKLEGDAERGKKVFLQKCAVCHGIEGKGRYGSGAYYRPALWGPYSFNDLAGMHSKPEKLASFIKSNMPFGSGGVLTVQEAWDVTAFLDKQPRPHKEKPAGEP